MLAGIGLIRARLIIRLSWSCCLLGGFLRYPTLPIMINGPSPIPPTHLLHPHHPTIPIDP